ncbi:hypothetical protein [Pseudomonas tolaasii]|nr:hypothetical protein [Pseudomonas tolaasii]
MRTKKKPIAVALAVLLAAGGTAAFSYFDDSIAVSAQAAEAPGGS